MALKELASSRHMRINIDGVAATRGFVCTYAEREDVCPRIGDLYPFVSEVQLFVQDIDVIPWGHPTGEGKDDFTYCKLIVHYTTRDPKRPQLSLDISVESLETGWGRTWYSDGTPANQHITTTHRRGELVIDRAYWFVPTGLIFFMVNKINQFPFEGCAPDTVLFAGAQGQTEYTNLGELVWRIRLRFIYRPIGWNYQWRQDTGAWDLLVPFLYAEADLNLLLL